MAQWRTGGQSVVSVRVYVEGGSSGKLESQCRKGFSEFFRKAGFSGHMPKIIACGSRNNALKKFCTPLSQANSEEIRLLLVDSEDPVCPSHTPWQHLSYRDQWEQPRGTQEEHAHLMVQCMESWFLADVATLERFFGSGFKSRSIAKRDDIENIPKDDVYRQLKSARQWKQ